MNISQIAIIGLGYVGLPFAVEFVKSNKNSSIKNRKVIGFDINDERISELKSGFDNFPIRIFFELSLSKGVSKLFNIFLKYLSY